MMTKRLAFQQILGLIFFSQIAFSQTAIESFDEYVEQARKDWNVPGLSIAVVKGDRIIFKKGYGVREIGKAEKVDTKTLFGAMSTTKAMTAVAMGILVDEGKIDWDDKVTKHLPEFKVGDPYVTKEITVRDLFTHNAGLEDFDYLWAWNAKLSTEKIVSQAKYAKPAYSFRGGFLYQNIMYLVAGKVIERVSGQSWETFMKERVFKPLGMNDTFSSYELSKVYKNRTSAHWKIDGKISKIDEQLAENIGPAGSVWSTADDTGKWVRFMVGNTKVNGKNFLRPTTYREILKPQVMVPLEQFYPSEKLTKPKWMTYGLGWFQHDYRDDMVNFHTGSLAGRTAIMGMLSDRKVGVYVFGNMEHAEVRHAIMYKAFDVFGFNDNSRDWSKEFKSLYSNLEKEASKKTKAVQALRQKNTKPSSARNDYVGVFRNELYGDLKVRLVGNELRLYLGPDAKGDLSHWHYDTFEVSWDKIYKPKSFVSFELDPMTRKVSTVKFAGITFKRVVRD